MKETQWLTLRYQLDRSALLGILAQQSDDVLQDLMRTVAQAAIDAQFQEFNGMNEHEAISSKDDPWVGAHEAGHLMGLGDKYDAKTNLPFHGYEKNIMGAYGAGGILENQITQIINDNP